MDDLIAGPFCCRSLNDQNWAKTWRQKTFYIYKFYSGIEGAVLSKLLARDFIFILILAQHCPKGFFIG
jgi:hypothetical protein